MKAVILYANDTTVMTQQLSHGRAAVTALAVQIPVMPDLMIT